MADNMSNASSTSNNLEHQKSPTTRAARFRRHICRLWWAYLFTAIVIAVAIVFPVLYVYYPQTAQRSVDASQIIVTAQSVRNPGPDSFDYGNVATLDISSPFSPSLYSWNGSYYLPGSQTPFLSVTVPQTRAYNGTTIDIEQRVKIKDMDEFAKNTDAIFSSKNFTVYLRGQGELREIILPTLNINYNKHIDLVGLNKLDGMNVTEFHLLTETLPDGANSAGNVTIPNPSVFTLQMGNVTLDLSVNGTSIGNATLPNFTLVPGSHKYLLHVTSNQSRVLELLKLPAYRCGRLPIDIKGRTSTYDGLVIPYFTAPLQKYPLRTTLDLMPTFKEAGLGSLLNGTCVNA